MIEIDYLFEALIFLIFLDIKNRKNCKIEIEKELNTEINTRKNSIPRKLDCINTSSIFRLNRDVDKNDELGLMLSDISITSYRIIARYISY